MKYKGIMPAKKINSKVGLTWEKCEKEFNKILTKEFRDKIVRLLDLSCGIGFEFTVDDGSCWHDILIKHSGSQKY